MHEAAKQIPYYEVAAMAARKIQGKEADRAILFCGTGMGVAIVANKFKGIYAGVVEGEFSGQHCKVINNCNVLTMGGWVVTPYRAKKIISLWLESHFTAGYDDIADFLTAACQEIKKIEEETMK
jgi:ribose 5-phosphate isomerase B